MFKNLHELFTKMPTEQDCRNYLAAQRWTDGKAVCPSCECDKCYTILGGKRYKCSNKECKRQFSVVAGTVFECSNIPLSKWFMGVFLATGHKKGISSHQLARDLGITQKTAWFMLHRIRTVMCDSADIVFEGVIQSDETFMSRKYRSDYVGLSEAEIDYKLANSRESKGAVVGLYDNKTGKIKPLVFDRLDRDKITDVIRDNVKLGSTLHTDESSLYRKLEYNGYYRESVVHSRKEWVKTSISAGKVHCNNVENFWSVMKRGIHGIYHGISYKHLNRYAQEFAYRYNSRDLKDYERFELTIQNLDGRLSHKDLVGATRVQ